MPTPELIQQWIGWIGESPLRFWVFVLVSIVLLSRALVGPTAKFYVRATTQDERTYHHDYLLAFFRKLAEFSFSQIIIYSCSIVLRSYYAIIKVNLEDYTAKYLFRLQSLVFFSWIAAIYISSFWVLLFYEKAELVVGSIAIIITNLLFFNILIKKGNFSLILLFFLLAMVNIIYLFTGLNITIGKHNFSFAALFEPIYLYAPVLTLHVWSVLRYKLSKKAILLLLFMLLGTILVSLPIFFYYPYIEMEQTNSKIGNLFNVFVNKELYVTIFIFALLTILGGIIFFMLIIPVVNFGTDVCSFAVTIHLLGLLVKADKLLSIVFIIALDVFLGMVLLAICLLMYSFTFFLMLPLGQIAAGADLNSITLFSGYYNIMEVSFFDAIGEQRFSRKGVVLGLLLSSTTLIPTIVHLVVALVLLLSRVFEPILQGGALRVHKLLLQEGEKGRTAAADVIALLIAVLIASVLIWVILS